MVLAVREAKQAGLENVPLATLREAIDSLLGPKVARRAAPAGDAGAAEARGAGSEGR